MEALARVVVRWNAFRQSPGFTVGQCRGNRERYIIGVVGRGSCASEDSAVPPTARIIIHVNYKKKPQ